MSISYNHKQSTNQQTQSQSKLDTNILYQNYSAYLQSSLYDNTNNNNYSPNANFKHIPYNNNNNNNNEIYKQTLHTTIYMLPIPEESRSHSYSHSNISLNDSRNSVNQSYQNQNNLVNEYNLATELLVMTIEIGNGNQDTIHIFENDDPQVLANNFCLKHGLSQNIISPLAQNIHNNIKRILKDRQISCNDNYMNQKNYDTIDSSEAICQPKSLNLDYTSNNSIKTNNIISRIDHNEQSSLSYYYLPMKLSSGNSSSLGKSTLSSTSIGNSLIAKNKKHIQRLNHSYDQNLQYEVLNNNTITQVNGNNNASINNIDSSFNNNYHQTSSLSSTNKHKALNKKSTSIKHKSSLSPSPSPSMPTSTSVMSNSNNIGFNQQKNALYPNHNISNIMLTDSNAISPNKDKSFEKNNAITYTPKINKTKGNNKTPGNSISSVKNLIKQKNDIVNSISPSPNHNIKKTISQTISNFGTMLYHKGLRRQEKLNKGLLEKKKEKLEQEVKECTFKPIVNPFSNEIVQQQELPKTYILQNKNRYDPPEELLIKYGKEVQEKLQRQRSMKNVQEIENCSFKPQINSLSEKMTFEKEKSNRSINRCLKLFNDHKTKVGNQESKPKINEQQSTFTVIQLNTSSISKISDQSTLDDRTVRKKCDKSERSISNIKASKDLEELNDPITGKPFFKPKTGRAPIQRNLENKPIWDHLYDKRNEVEDLKKNLLEKEQRTLEDNFAKSNERSNIIMENIKKKRLQNIFQALDSDNDGIISSTNIDISAIDTKTLEIIAPLLCEMEELEQTLNEDKFIEICENLLKTLNIPEKSYLLQRKRDNSNNSKFEDACTFKPQINKKSKKIAEIRRPQGKNTLFDTFVEEKKIIDEKLNQEREKNFQDELKECSFKPTLNPSYSVPSLFSQNESYCFNPQNKLKNFDLMLFTKHYIMPIQLWSIHLSFICNALLIQTE